jgi:hypothetical protein
VLEVFGTFRGSISMKQATLGMALLGLVFFGVVIVLEISGVFFSKQVVFSQAQPPNVQYGDTYRVDVVRQRLALRLEFTILIHRQGVPEYGYALKYPEAVIDPRKMITQVIWENTGVTLEFPDQTRLVIPKERFVGGR